jgi:hypothetical protein
MAPEQVEKPSEVDHRADIYSLGVVFYELLTGELPLGRFAAPSAKADLDSRVDAIVMRALAKERELRQQSAGQVKTEVEGLGTPAEGTPPPAPTAGLWSANRDFEYKSTTTLFGLPLAHVVSGWDPKSGRPREARGILAVGPRAVGVLAVGGQAIGLLAFGGVAVGGFAFGGIAMGGLAFGGLAAGLAAFGGLAVGLLLACGGIAVGLMAFGGIAVGKRALGGLAVTQYQATPGYWGNWLRDATPFLWLLAAIPAMVPVAVSLWVRQLQKRLGETGVRPNPWPHRLFCLLVALVALPASAVVAAVLAPIMRRASGGLGGITAGLIPMAIGALLVWLFVRTRLTTAQAQPREQWNPWPKRLFVAVIALVVVPVSLVIVGLLVPYLLWHAAVLPPLPTPMASGEPQLKGVVAEWPAQLVPTERLVSDSQLRLRWNLRSRQPAMVRLSIGANIQEFELRPDRSGAGYSLPVNVMFNPQEDGEALLMEAFAGDAPGGTVLLAHLPGRPAELLIKANELVAGELPLKFNTPVWIAFAGLEQVRLEVLPAPTAPAPPTPPSNDSPQEPPAPGSTPPQ